MAQEIQKSKGAGSTVDSEISLPTSGEPEVVGVGPVARVLADGACEGPCCKVADCIQGPVGVDAGDGIAVKVLVKVSTYLKAQGLCLCTCPVFHACRMCG